MSYLDYEDNRGPGRPAKYPLKDMAPGDTVFLPEVSRHLVDKAVFRRRPMRFKCRTVVFKGVKGTRVWRLS